jgi:hypothetical protein
MTIVSPANVERAAIEFDRRLAPSEPSAVSAD